MLELNLSTILLQMANFFILVFILYRFLFQPVQNILKKRAIETTKAMDDARVAEQTAQEAQKLYEEKTNNIDAEISARKNEARIVIEQTRQQMLQDVQSQIEQLRKQTEETLGRIQQQAIQQNKEKLGNLAAAFAQGIISGVMKPELGDAFQKEFVDSIGRMELLPFIEDSAPGEAPTIRVITAKHLNPVNKERLEVLVESQTTQPLNISYEIDPGLIAGGILRFENKLIDGSLQGQIKHFKQQYQETV
jgi:F-type H+-transporting ATPase subunit b